MELFSGEERERFVALMSGLPGADEEMWAFDGLDGRTSWSYFGPAPLKAAIHWSHLMAFWSEDELYVRGDLTWEQWCQWEDAFVAGAVGFPVALLGVRKPPE